VEVKVNNRDDLLVRARHGYFARRVGLVSLKELQLLFGGNKQAP